MNKLFLIILVITMTLFASFGSFFFKKSTSGTTIISILKNKFLYIGGFLYVFSALTNIVILKYMDLTVVMPISAIAYVWTMFISKIFLKEKITLLKLFGIISIVAGVIIISFK